MTVGMQARIDDSLSDEIATALYGSLLDGLTFGEAMQQVRQQIARDSRSVGLPVGYVARNGWKHILPVRAGYATVGSLRRAGSVSLGGEIQPPRPLLGRNRELYQLAKLFTGGQKVVTVAGTGGMGKTALAASFAERFAWLWRQGVSAYSFASEVNWQAFSGALLRILFDEQQAGALAGATESQARAAILQAAENWHGLWLFDNYESIMQGLAAAEIDAQRIHRLVADLANGGANLLLTSREQPAGLRNEQLFPEGAALRGLGEAAGAALFAQHSVKAQAAPREHAALALDIQRAADGHPLAIALLAGEYDVSAASQAEFLQNWEAELATARRDGLAGHHVTFLTAFERSYRHLPADLQQALAALSIFPFPFFAEGAQLVWEKISLPAGAPETQTAVRQALHNIPGEPA